MLWIRVRSACRLRGLRVWIGYGARRGIRTCPLCVNWNIRHEPSCAVHGLTYVVPIVNTRPIVNTNRQRCGGPLDVRTPVSVPSTLARPKALAVVLLYHVGLLMPCGSSTVIRLNGRHATPVSQFSPGGKSTATTIYIRAHEPCMLHRCWPSAASRP